MRLKADPIFMDFQLYQANGENEKSKDGTEILNQKLCRQEDCQNNHDTYVSTNKPSSLVEGIMDGMNDVISKYFSKYGMKKWPGCE